MGPGAVLVSIAALSAVDKQQQGDVDLTECPECVGHQWEVLQASADAEPSDEDLKRFLTPGGPTRHVVDNGVRRQATEGKTYSDTIFFSGYSSTELCSMNNRTKPYNGHDKCPLVQPWYQMWKPGATALTHFECWIDDMVPVQNGKTLSNPPGTTTILGRCSGSPEPGKYVTGAYDFRYGGIRPQDNPDAALYPEIARHIEKRVEETGLPVLIKGYSGGTINSYAFMMSQTREWRQKHIRAYIAWAPVFGGTIRSIDSILHGWQVGKGDGGRCLGRSVAIKLPSVLWMWPHPGEGFGEWNKTEVLVQTPKRNYTAYDLDRLLEDSGLTATRTLYDLEKTDFLDVFEPPMVDTYVYYGFGQATIAGYKLKRNITAETDGPTVCPPSSGYESFKRTWDDGDVTAPRRSCARAQAWAKPHAQAGFVLKNYGYKGQGHSSSCKVKECKPDYECMMAVLDGKNPLPAHCKDH